MGTGRLDLNVDALTLHTRCGVWRVVWALMGLKASTFKSNCPFLRGGFKHQLYSPMSLPSAGVMRQLLHQVLFPCVLSLRVSVFGDMLYFCHVFGTLDLKLDA